MVVVAGSVCSHMSAQYPRQVVRRYMRTRLKDNHKLVG